MTCGAGSIRRQRSGASWSLCSPTNGAGKRHNRIVGGFVSCGAEDRAIRRSRQLNPEPTEITDYATSGDALPALTGAPSPPGRGTGAGAEAVFSGIPCPQGQGVEHYLFGHRASCAWPSGPGRPRPAAATLSTESYRNRGKAALSESG